MNYLDQTGLEHLWSKIKTYVGNTVEGGAGEIVVNWDDINGKPSTFAPSAHTHTVSQITDFPTNLVTNVTISGSGNAVTNASFSNNTLTITKGTIESGGITEVTFNNLSDDLKVLIAKANDIKMGYGRGPVSAIYGGPQKPSGSWIGVYTGSLGSTTCPTYIPVKTINNQSIFGSGNIDVPGGRSDGNNYPTAIGLTYSQGSLEVAVDRNGMGSISDNIAINWDTLYGKPSWAESGEITWDDITDPPDIVNDVHVFGDGNAVVNASYDGGILTLTKGTISAGTSGITQSEADGRYVNISGDTMTGDLNVTGHTVSAQTVDVTNIEALQIAVSGNTNNDAINVNNGGVTAKAFYESSDVSLKENIAPITKEATNAVDCLAFKQFNFKDDKDKITKYGVIAQEVEAVGLSNLVSTNEEGVKSVDYISLLILKIEALEKRIAKLEAERG